MSTTPHPSAAPLATDSDRLRQLDNDHVWHPFVPMQAYRTEDAPIIADSDGFDLIDVDGRRYLDGISSLWCNVHGHRVPEIDAAIAAQLGRVGHSTLLGMSNVPSIELAAELVRVTPPGLNKVFYSDSGASAVEVALKMAWQYHHQVSPTGSTPRDRFVCLSSAYHGDTIGSTSLGGIDLFHKVYGGLLFQTIQVPTPGGYRLPEGRTPEEQHAFCVERLRSVLEAEHERIVAVVIEPLVQGAAGILVHPDGFLKTVRDLSTEFDLPLIADEVAVGFGRTGSLFACEQEGVTPDFLCLAKGLTGGYLPLAATLTTDRIESAFLGEPHEGRTFFHGHTFTGNPLGCAAALASLELFATNDVLDNASRNAELIGGRLSHLTQHPHVGEVRQKGLMVGIELVADRETQAAFPSEFRLGHQVTLAARKRGVILRPLGDVIVLMPAPAMPPELIDQLCDVALESIEEVVTEARARIGSTV